MRIHVHKLLNIINIIYYFILYVYMFLSVCYLRRKSQKSFMDTPDKLIRGIRYSHIYKTLHNNVGIAWSNRFL